MSVDTDTESVIPGIFERGGKYGFRANIPGSKGKQIRRGGYLTQDAAYKARIRFLSGRIDTAGGGTTVNAWFDEFLVAKETECRATTVSGYTYALSLVRDVIGDIQLLELNETHLRNAYKRLVPDYCTSSIKTVHWRVRTALRQAVKEARLPRCPADNVTAPKGKQGRKRRTWTFEQLMIFAKYTSNERDAAMWAFWITTGLRRGEICGLRWPKLDLDRGLVTVDWQRTLTTDGRIVEGDVKTDDSERVIPLSNRVVEALRAWRAAQNTLRLEQGPEWNADDYTFTTFRGNIYYPGSFNNRLAELANRAGLPILTPHELRHTYATRAIENGADVKVLSKLLGHYRIEVTLNMYVHPNEDQSRDLNDSLADRMFG